jgi:hypothetical protein
MAVLQAKLLKFITRVAGLMGFAPFRRCNDILRNKLQERLFSLILKHKTAMYVHACLYPQRAGQITQCSGVMRSLRSERFNTGSWLLKAKVYYQLQTLCF